MRTIDSVSPSGSVSLPRGEKTTPPGKSSSTVIVSPAALGGRLTTGSGSGSGSGPRPRSMTTSTVPTSVAPAGSTRVYVKLSTSVPEASGSRTGGVYEQVPSQKTVPPSWENPSATTTNESPSGSMSLAITSTSTKVSRVVETSSSVATGGSLTSSTVTTTSPRSQRPSPSHTEYASRSVPAPSPAVYRTTVPSMAASPSDGGTRVRRLPGNRSSSGSESLASTSMSTTAPAKTSATSSTASGGLGPANTVNVTWAVDRSPPSPETE